MQYAYYAYMLSPDKVNGRRSSRAVPSYGAAQEVLCPYRHCGCITIRFQSSPYCHNQLSKPSINTILLYTSKFFMWFLPLTFSNRHSVTFLFVLPSALHVLPLQSYLMKSVLQYQVIIKNYEAPQQVIFSVVLLHSSS
jgi:hypothetical protein